MSTAAPNTKDTIAARMKVISLDATKQSARSSALKKRSDGLKNARDYKLCLYLKHHETLLFYRHLDLCLASPAVSDSEMVNEYLKEYIKKDADLATSISEAVTMLKEVKHLLSTIHDDACKLDRCLEEEKRCNLEYFKAITKQVRDFDIRFGRIRKLSSEAYDLAKCSFDGGVDLAGIQSFNDVDSIALLTTELKDRADKFKADVDANIKSAADGIAKAFDEALKAGAELGKTRAERCKVAADAGGDAAVHEFLCEPECMNCDEGKHKLRQICNELTICAPDSDDADGLKRLECDDEQQSDKRSKQEQAD